MQALVIRRVSPPLLWACTACLYPFYRTQSINELNCSDIKCNVSIKFSINTKTDAPYKIKAKCNIRRYVCQTKFHYSQTKCCSYEFILKVRHAATLDIISMRLFLDFQRTRYIVLSMQQKITLSPLFMRLISF